MDKNMKLVGDFRRTSGQHARTIRDTNVITLKGKNDECPLEHMYA